MGSLRDCFYVTGKASARRPWTSIWIGIIIVAIGSLGFINMQSTVSYFYFRYRSLFYCICDAKSLQILLIKGLSA